MTRDVDFEIGADVSPLKQKLREAADAINQFGREGESFIGGMTGPLAALQEKFVLVGAILAGGAVFQEAVQMTANYTKESINLGRALGVSATEASNYIAALEDVDVSQGDFIAAAKGLSKELKNNESDLQGMGLSTRDAAGNLRPLNQLTVEAIEILNGYKEGTDRAIAGQTMFGKSFQLTGNLIELNSQTVADNAELQRSLASAVGQESVEAFAAFDAAGDKSALTLKSVSIAIGNALLPVLTDLANWFVAIGPAAIVIIRGALGGLVATFHLVTTGVTVLWETINAMVVTVAEPIRALAEALGRAISGDWDGAKSAITGIAGNITGAWGKAFDTIGAKAQSTRDRIWNLFADGTPVATPDGSGKSAAGLVKSDGVKDKKAKAAKADPSMMPYYEAGLAEAKRVASEQNALREYTKGEELAYWQTLLSAAQLGSKDRLAIEKKVADLTVQIRREAAKETVALEAEASRSRDALAIGHVDAARAAAQAALDLEQITKVQMAELEVKFEADRFAIQKAALQERLLLSELDPNASPVELARIKNELLEIEQKHQTNVITMQGQLRLAQKQAALESLQIWSSLGDRMSGLWDKGIQAMMNGTLTWRNGLRAVGAELVGWFATDVVGSMIKSWLAGEVKKLAIKMGFLGQEVAAQTTASTTTMAVKGTETAVVSGGNAVKAGTGAAAALASIPFVGPVLALAAMATVFAAVSSLAGKTKSAAKGYDIPKGINPMVQTHEEEMILPAKYANAIRSMTNGGAQEIGGAAFSPSISVHAMDSRDVARTLRKGGALHTAIRGLRRDFVKV